MIAVPHHTKKTNRLRCSFPKVSAEDNSRYGCAWRKTEGSENDMWQKDEWGGWYLEDQKCIGSMPEATGVWNKDDETGGWYLTGAIIEATVSSKGAYQVAV